MLSIDVNLLAIHLVLYLVFFILFTKLAAKPLLQVVLSRVHGISALRERGETLEKETEELRASYKEKIEAAHKKAITDMESLRTAAAQEERELIERSRLAASALVKKTDLDIQNAVSAARSSLAPQLGTLAKTIADKLAFFALLTLTIAPSLAEASEGAEHHAGIGDLLMPAINFTILVVLLYKLLKKPILNLFASRGQDAQNELSALNAKIEAAEAALAEVRSKLAQSQAEMETIAAERKKIAEAEYKKTVERATTIAAEIAANATAVCSSMVEKARQQLVEEVTDQAIAQATMQLSAKPSLGLNQTLSSAQFASFVKQGE